MKSLLCTVSNLFLFASLIAQNVGVGEIAPIAKLEIKSDGNNNSTSSLLIKNSDNNRLFHLNSAGSATLGNLNLASPGHLLGIHNGLQPARAHIGLYATGALTTDAGSINRIGFSNVTNGFRQFEIQSYSGTNTPAHSITFKYFNFNTSPTTETTLLTLNADGSANFPGPIHASNFNITSPGVQHDFLTRGTNPGDVSSKKGTGALGLNYIICVNGTFPSTGAGAASDQPLLAEVRLYAGVNPPQGWMFCHGQILTIASNTGLFALLGTTYGGNGVTTFGLPDLRGAAAVQQGTPTTGRSWTLGERSF